jgi:hypothetical protein
MPQSDAFTLIKAVRQTPHACARRSRRWRPASRERYAEYCRASPTGSWTRHTGVLLALRRGLMEETGAATIGEMMLIDMAAMRVQAMIGNMALLIEAEMFGQRTLRADWKEARGGGERRDQGPSRRGVCRATAGPTYAARRAI